MAESLIIKEFNKAIAPSPHQGFGLMRCVDLQEYPGAFKVKAAPTSLFSPSFSNTFTAVAATNICTLSAANVPPTGMAVALTTTTTLPAGLSLATNYFVIKLSSTTFSLATTLTNAYASTAIDITDAGTGTHTCTSVNPGTVNHFVYDQRTGREFCQDSNGLVWFYDANAIYFQLLNGNTITNSFGNGIALFLNSDASALYLFAFRNAFIDVINVTGNSNVQTPSWTNAWQALNTSAGSNYSHHAINGQDNIVYFCDDRWVGSIIEVAGQVFLPSSGATYTYSNKALDLPNGELAWWLEELGTNLYIAGNRSNRIYPWDRHSDSYALPLAVPESRVYRLKNVNSVIYILAGIRGNIYVTQGSYVKLAATLPDQVINASGTLSSTIVVWGGVGSMYGAFLFGASVSTTANSGAYLLYPDGRLVIDQTPSSGATNVTAFECANSSNAYWYGYSGGADNHSTARYTSLQGVVQSELYRVSTKKEKAAYSEIQLVLAKPASTGHVTLSYRTDTSSSFTNLTGAAFSMDGTNATFGSDTIGLTDLENIQIQAEADGTPEVVEIRLLP